MALVRVYCGLASVDHDAPPASAAPTLVAAVVDDAGRLLDVREINDDPAGYAQLGAMLVERSSGPSGPAVATDSDEYLVTGLLTAAGRPLAVADDDLVDDFAERFADDESREEMAPPRAERKAIGLARALQAGALSAVALPAPRDLACFTPFLTAHAALANGRHAAAIALREVLRELYPAALRAYPDPAERVPLAVLDALPEPGMLAGPATRGRDSAVIAHLVADGIADEQTVGDAVTALRVAIAETPRRPAVDKALTAAVAETVQQAVAAVRACDAGCAGLVAALASRMTTTRTTTAPPAGRRSAATGPAAPALATALYAVHTGVGEPTRTGVHTPRSRTRSGVSDKTGRREGALPAASHGPAAPRPVTTPPTAPHPATPAAARSSTATPVSAPPRQTPPTNPVAPVSPAAPSARPAEPPANRPTSAPPPPPGITPAVPTKRAVPPVDAGEPFRATLTTAAINSARAERQRLSFPVKARTNGEPRPSNGISATDLTIPVPAPRPSADAPPPGSRANWPLVNSREDDRANGSAHEPGHSLEEQTPTDLDLSADPGNNGRVTPPWLADDLPPEPPMLRLVESPSLADPALLDEPARMDDRRGAPSARPGAPRASERDGHGARPRRSTVEHSGPPVTDEGDGDLLIFAAARSAWFTGQTDDPDVQWSSIADSGWRAAEQAARPKIGDETKAGLPKRVPQANLVPGSPLREERPLHIVRDAASMAANTMGYFQGWRRGQEIGGYAVGGRPGRESADGWDFQRDDDDRDDRWDQEYRSVGYRS